MLESTWNHQEVSMIVSAQLLERLAKLNADEGILSVYLRIDPTLMHDPHHPTAAFKAALKHTNDRSPDGRPKELRREADRVLQFLEERWRPEGKGLVIFSSQPIDLWDTISLNVAVPSATYFGDTASVRLLARIIDEHERYAAVVVNKEDAHLFIIHMGEIEQESEIFDDDVPGRQSKGGWSQARFQRHTDFHVHEHLKHVLQRLERYRRAHPFDRLILGGPDEAITEFQKMLPQSLQERLIGTFHPGNRDKPQQILDKAAAVAKGFERSQEEALVTRIADDADAGGSGVLGAVDTLKALNEGRVHVLVVGADVTIQGSQCPSCGLLAGTDDSCPTCGAGVVAAPDIVERAMRHVYENNGRVEVVFDRAAEWLAARGGIGAQLRF
jgi:peptide subunit release factor 1 (eRF1)